MAIARAISNRPELILADEPTGELDTISGQQIMALFREIVVREGVTVIVATHDPTVEDYASLVFKLRDGRIISGNLQPAC